MQKKNPRITSPRTDLPAIAFRRANLLDIPLIFELLQEGAETGSFTDDYVQRTGSVRLLRLVLHNIFRQVFQRAESPRLTGWLMISLQSDEPVGFLKITRPKPGQSTNVLELLAICPEFRNRGIGTAVFEHVVSTLPEGSELFVHCTKYARAMQHILKRHRMKRNVRFGVPQLEEYKSSWGGFAHK